MEALIKELFGRENDMTHIIMVFLLAGIFWVLLNIDHNLVELGKSFEQLKLFLQRRDK